MKITKKTITTQATTPVAFANQTCTKNVMPKTAPANALTGQNQREKRKNKMSDAKTVEASKIMSGTRYENPISKYIAFAQLQSKAKTKVFELISLSSHEELGIIKWHPAWRQYCFFTTDEFKVVYSTGCLADISKFVTSLNEKHKKQRKVIRCKVKEGWVTKGREGKVLADNVWVEQWWTPVLWDNEEDPCFFKTQGLELLSKREAKNECEQGKKN